MTSRFVIQTFKPNLDLFRGPRGATGAQGFAGQNSTIFGVTGFTGGIGSQGTQGNQGHQGTSAIGNQGAQGAQGSQGGIGLIGSQGPAGAPGPASTLPSEPMGNQGFQGAQGFGIQGFFGSQGDPGEFSGLVAHGMIFRQESGFSLIETDLSPNFQLIQSKTSGSHPCAIGDISAFTDGSPLSTINTFESQIVGQPAGFKIQPGIGGQYLLSYHLTLRIQGEVVPRIFQVEARTADSTTIPGSQSQITVTDSIVHLSHLFQAFLLENEEVGLYITNFDSNDICLDFGNSSFVAKLLEQVVTF